MIFKRIEESEIDIDDWFWLKKVADILPCDYNGVDLVRMIAARELFLFRFQEKCQGLILVEIRKHPGGSELYIFALVGKGLLKNSKEIHQEIMNMAKAANCRWVGGIAIRKGLQVLYEKVLHARPLGVAFLQEIEPWSAAAEKPKQ